MPASSSSVSSRFVGLEPRLLAIVLALSGDVGVPSSSTGSALTDAADMVSSGRDAVTGEIGGSDEVAIFRSLAPVLGRPRGEQI